MALIGLGPGLIAGLLVGALLLSGNDQASTAAGGTKSPTPSPTQKPEATQKLKPAPTESAGWEPCEKPGLCDFLKILDNRLAARDLDGVMELIKFVPYQCGSPQTQLKEGTYPIECRDWPYDDAVPAAGFAPFDAQGFATSRWVVRDHLEEFITGEESDCAGDKEGIERRVRVVLSPPDLTLYWHGEVAVLLGAVLTCRPFIEPESAQRYVFNLRPSGGSQWQVESMIEVAYDRCQDSIYRFPGKLRYYPLGEGPPQGPHVCLVEGDK
jgi:hypothetical protein